MSSPKCFELVVVRHGETAANKSYIIQGHMDTPLSEAGERQAQLVAARLAKDTFHLAVTSDLARAHQTGRAIHSANNSLAGAGLELEKWEVARERCFGDLEGQSVEKMTAQTKNLTKDQLLAWGPTNGETGQMFRER